MATILQNKLVPNIGITEQLLVTTASNTRSTIIGLSLTNMSELIILASIRVADNVEVTSAYYAKDIVVPPNTSLRVVNGGEKLVLGPSMSVYVSSNTAASLDVVMSYIDVL
jgi:hypothetical protein